MPDDAVATRRLAELSTVEVARRCGPASIALLPIGATEQHGPHLPLCTDTVVAERLAEEVVAEAGDDLDLWLLPALSYSKSNEHLGTAGTLSLSTGTMLAMLDDIATSLLASPIRKIAFLNGHGGNSALLDVAARDLRVRHGFMTFLLHTILPPDQGGPTLASELNLGIHGGHDETAMVLAVAPHLVRMDLAERQVPEWLTEYEHIGIGGPVRVGWHAHDLSPNGVIGDPTGATVEYGQRLFAGMIKAVRQQLDEVARFRFEPGEAGAP